MGWLSTERKGSKVYFSDGGLDACADFLSDISDAYRNEKDRLPSLAEILLLLETELNDGLAELIDDQDVEKVSALKGKLKKAAAKPKAVLGDIVSIPITRDQNTFAQVVEIVAKDVVVISLFKVVQSEPGNVARLIESERIGQFRCEQTGVHWNHWKVLGNVQVPEGFQVKKPAYSFPCFVAELEIVELLRDKGTLPSDFRLYADVGASHPNLQADEINVATEIMKFLDSHKLLSKAGKQELADGQLGSRFWLHSGLLTAKGAAFYDLVFKKSYMSDFLSHDTTKKLEELWKEFK